MQLPFVCSAKQKLPMNKMSLDQIDCNTRGYCKYLYNKLFGDKICPQILAGWGETGEFSKFIVQNDALSLLM